MKTELDTYCDNSEMLTAVYAAIDEFNIAQPPDRQLEKNPSEVLSGANGKLDSLGLVRFLITVEDRLTSHFAKPVTLANEKAFSLRNSPFATVSSLSKYIGELLEEVPNA